MKIGIRLSAIPRIAGKLRECGYEVNEDRVDWRVLMWRRDCKQWSQAYTGLTARAKVERSTLTVFGPEVEALDEVFD